MPISGDTEIDRNGGATISGRDTSMGIRARMGGREIAFSTSNSRISTVIGGGPITDGIPIAGMGINFIATRGPGETGAAITGAAITGATTGDRARRRIGVAAMRFRKGLCPASFGFAAPAICPLYRERSRRTAS